MKKWICSLLLVVLLMPCTAQAMPARFMTNPFVLDKGVKAPKKLIMTTDTKQMVVGETISFSIEALPATASAIVVWNSFNRKVATVDALGQVTAIAPGSVKIRARSKKKPAVSVSRTIAVTTDPRDAQLSIAGGKRTLSEGDAIALNAQVLPANCGLTVQWSSDASTILSVDAKGKVWAHSPGQATVRAWIEGGPSQETTFTITGHPMSLVVPDRITPESGMADNLEKIHDVRRSALAQVSSLYRQGLIAVSDAQRRTSIINRAFSMYHMPWATTQTQKYWTRKYGTKKDFRPGVIYYGMPYIQHGQSRNYINRTYDDIKAVNQKFWVDSGKGYLLMNHQKKRDGMYVGNDCSSFVGMSIFGNTNRNAFIRTRGLYSSKLYKTVTGHTNMRPGDILVRSSSHVVFFLYYTDIEKTRMMILEQGGGDEQLDLHNTVTCSIVDVKAYKNYRPRRLKALG